MPIIKNVLFDFCSRGEFFDVYAFDSRKQVALIKKMLGDNLKPYKVVKGFVYDGFEYSYDDMESFSDLDVAYNNYDLQVIVSELNFD